MSTATYTAPTSVLPDEEKVADLDSVWVVLVWNDPVNLISYVSMVLTKLFGYSKEESMRLTMQIDREGKAVVANGSKEKCELDVFRLHEHGLWATMQVDK